MIKVDRNKIDKPSVFTSSEMGFAVENLRGFYSGLKGERSQKRFNQKFEVELRTPILHALYELFNGKCAYCESKLARGNTTNYDHFRPKFGARGLEKEFADEHYWWLTYEWGNFYSSCIYCNRNKASWFPIKGKRSKPKTSYERVVAQEKNLIIDPCIDQPKEHLTFHFDGMVKPITEKGDVTIEILQLNRKELVFGRERTMKEIYSDWEKLLKLWPEKRNNWKKVNEIGIVWGAILTGTSKKPFLAAARTLIEDRISTDGNKEIKKYFDDKQYTWVRKTKMFSSNVDELKSDVLENTPMSKDIVNDTKKGMEIIANRDARSIIKSQVYLEFLEVKNYKCFDHLKLNFARESKLDEQNWFLFLGENGVGKSSIIKAIAIALSPQSYLDRMPDEVIQNRLLKNGKKVGYIELTYNGGEKIRVTFRNTAHKLKTSLTQPITKVIGYGSTRLLPKKRN